MTDDAPAIGMDNESCDYCLSHKSLGYFCPGIKEHCRRGQHCVSVTYQCWNEYNFGMHAVHGDECCDCGKGIPRG